MANRREFLTASLATAVALGLSSTVLAKASKPLRILVLGGTGFLGPHFVEAARARGHVLTLFNRGKTNPGLFPDIEKLQGDRKTDLKALEGRHWDAVLDTSAYIPADVTRSAGLLSKNVDHYLIVSTISVYAKLDKPGMDVLFDQGLTGLVVFSALVLAALGRLVFGSARHHPLASCVSAARCAKPCASSSAIRSCGCCPTAART